MSYREQHSFEKRRQDVMEHFQKFPGNIPIIMEKVKSSSSIPDLAKKRFSVNRTKPFNVLSSVVRQRLRLSPDQALFYFCGNTVLGGSDLLDSIYKEHADPDGYLYITYSAESTFG